MKQEDFESFHLNILREKLFQLNSRFEKNTVLILVLAIVFLFLDDSLIKEIEFAGIKLNDINYLIVIIPPLFGFFQLQNYIISSEITRIVDEIVNITKGVHPSEDSEIFEVNFRLLLSPISIFREFINGLLSMKTGLILFSLLIYLPALFLIFLLPLIFLSYTLIRLDQSTFPERIFVNVSFVISIWFLVSIIYLFIRTNSKAKDK